MKIAVLGATGGTGKYFVLQALNKGHQITALARSPKKLQIDHPRLNLVEGNALDLETVQQTVVGHAAVLCALGGAAVGKPTTIRRDGTDNIIKALTAAGESPHLVIVSSLGSGDSKQQMGWLARNFILFLLRHPLADHNAQEALVQQSNLPWTILRPTSLNNDGATGNLHVTTPPQTVQAQKSVSRADVAIFALAAIEKQDYVGQAITLTAA